jgi:AraC family transcriptional regulator
MSMLIAGRAAVVKTDRPDLGWTVTRTTLNCHSREMNSMNTHDSAEWGSHQTAVLSMVAAPEDHPAIPGHPHPSSFARGYDGFVAEAAGILDDVRPTMERNPECARAAALRLGTFLTPSAALGSPGVRGGLAPWQKRKVDRYLREHVECTLYVEEIANQVSLSVSHFSRTFKESFGTTPHMHVIRLRLELAQRMMLTTKEPLSHIALACGLADQSHLSKLFRSKLSETPGAWRRRNLSDAQAEARSRRPRASRSARANIAF